jgi:hypothetical protein
MKHHADFYNARSKSLDSVEQIFASSLRSINIAHKGQV